MLFCSKRLLQLIKKKSSLLIFENVQNTGPLTGHFPATAMPFRLGKTPEDVLDGQPDVRCLH